MHAHERWPNSDFVTPLSKNGSQIYNTLNKIHNVQKPLYLCVFQDVNMIQ